MKYITVDTKLVALLGTPLRQSISYLLQNQVYQQMGLDFFYFPMEVEQAEALPDVLAGVRRMNFGGLGVTKPYKEAILPYLDECDEAVRQMGACNTICVKNGRLIGHNTDGVGCVNSLKNEGGLQLSGKRYIIFGAGGAARAVSFALAREGAAEIIFADINEHGQQLAKSLNDFYPNLARSFLVRQTEELAHIVPQMDVVMNMSGLGMAPHEGETPVNSDWLRPNQFCYDAIYEPARSQFLADGEQAGCKTQNGLGMVIYQGLEQIRLWTGMTPEAEIMFRAFQEASL